MEKKNTTKEKLLNAFDISEKKTISDTCKIAGVTLGTFYFHYYKDSNFQKAILSKQQQKLETRIQAIGA